MEIQSEQKNTTATLFDVVSNDPELSAYPFVNEPDSELCRSILERTDYDAERAAQELRRYLGLRKECELIFQCYTRESLREAAVNKPILLVPGGVSAVGSVLVFRVGAWDPLVCSLAQISALLGFILESLSLDTQVAAKGFSVIFDLKGISLRQLKALSPSVIKKLHVISNEYLPIKCNYQLIANAAFQRMVSTFLGFFSFAEVTLALPQTEEELIDPILPNLPTEYGGSSHYNWEEEAETIVNSNCHKIF